MFRFVDGKGQVNNAVFPKQVSQNINNKHPSSILHRNQFAHQVPNIRSVESFELWTEGIRRFPIVSSLVTCHNLHTFQSLLLISQNRFRKTSTTNKDSFSILHDNHINSTIGYQDTHIG